MTTEETIRQLVERARADEKCVGTFSTGEVIAVALVLNRADWLPKSYATTLEAVERLGADWTKAALNVQRAIPGDWISRG